MAETNSKQSKIDGVHILVRIVSIILLLSGLPLVIGGVYLVSLGGSFYYVFAGIAICSAALMLWKGRRLGLNIYLGIFALTILWSFYEAGLSFWPLVPRLVAPIFLAGAVLLIAPLLRGTEKPANSKPYLFGGAAMAFCFIAFFVGMFKPHDVILNRDILTKGQVSQVNIAAGSNWTAYGRTGLGTRYAPFDQITPDNIDKLEIAWTARTGFLADQSKSEDDQNTPLYVDGAVYQCSPAGQITAIDGVTGAILWQFDPKAKSTDWKRCRSLGYFDPGPADSCGPRIIETTVDARLIAIRTRDGQPCETFGQGGTVNIWDGMGDTDRQYMSNTSGVVVAKGKIIFGARVTDNVTKNAPSGVIRAYDALTGKMAWVWDLGQPNLKGAPTEGQSYTPGTPNAWSLLSYDEDLGLVYLPLGNSSPDIYGGQRRDFDDKYSSSVVALNIDTGNEVWKFQTVYHDLWDYDVPAQPVLADIPDGKGGTIPGLIQVTKRSQIFVLDRRTGKPIKPVEDRPVPKSDGTIKGEYYSPVQPYSTGMAAVGAAPLTESQMWGATPIDQMLCRILFKKNRYDGDFTTPSTTQIINWPGPQGGANYGSTAIDEANNVMVFAEMRLPLLQRLVPRDKVTPDMRYEGESGAYHPMNGSPYAMQRGLFFSPLMIPCLQPPWGSISAVDLATGKHIWQQPSGTAKDLAVGPGLGVTVAPPPLGGAIVTGGGIAWFGSFQDYFLRAYDSKSGEKLWEGRLPLGAQSTPISYIGKDGRQYIVISTGGARYNMSKWGDYVVAFALPRK